jgi:threonine dehydrogenase-like Zn-dependent dehydrogenase
MAKRIKKQKLTDDEIVRRNLNLQMLNKRQKKDKPVVLVLMKSGRISIKQAEPDVFLPLPVAA